MLLARLFTRHKHRNQHVKRLFIVCVVIVDLFAVATIISGFVPGDDGASLFTASSHTTQRVDVGTGADGQTVYETYFYTNTASWLLPIFGLIDCIFFLSVARLFVVRLLLILFSSISTTATLFTERKTTKEEAIPLDSRSGFEELL